MSKVLVTGGSGFLGIHSILCLLKDGHAVRTTVRSAKKQKAAQDTLATAGVSTDDVEFVQADLLRDDGWHTAANGCDYIWHVASPFPGASPKDEDEIIRPAREGTLRVLRAARATSVKRVVLTSSFAAVGYGIRPTPSYTFTEADWTDPRLPNPPYIRSKVLSERAAWDFVASEGDGLELTVINPVGIFGPALSADYSTSIGIVKAMLEGGLPGLPDVAFGVVDVRDVADLHLRAMRSEQASGHRFLAAAGPLMSMAEIASVLYERLGAAAAKVPTKRLPSWQVRLAALVDKRAREMVPNLGVRRKPSSEKARQNLGWCPRSNEDAIAAAGTSLLDLGLIAR